MARDAETHCKAAILYKIVNTVNGHFYIGITVKTERRRFCEHMNDAIRSSFDYPLHRAIRKYGRNAFSIETLMRFSSRKEACTAEVKAIADMKPDYNVTLGGDGVDGIPRTPEWNAKVGAANKGRKMPKHVVEAHLVVQRHPLTCVNDGMQFISINEASRFYGVCKGSIQRQLRGNSGWARGLVFVSGHPELSDAEKQNILADAKQKRHAQYKSPAMTAHWAAKGWTGPESRRRKVYCVNNGKWYSDAEEAAADCGISAASVSGSCRNEPRRLTPKGMRFSYSEIA